MIDFIDKLKTAQENIKKPRLQQLEALAALISDQIAEHGFSKVNFICTHNSRRSQLSELMLTLLVDEYAIPNIKAYSGGTEATSFNYRMVDALSELGIDLLKYGSEDNPLYIRTLKNRDHFLFSKKFDDSFNPNSKYIAVTVCGDADENCPVIFGAEKRYHLPYIDPKVSDGSEHESVTYQNKVLKIGSEMLKLTQLIIGGSSIRQVPHSE